MTATILLIEDNEEIRENTAEILEIAHYKVEKAQNGKEGMEIVRRQVPDLIICDIMMPVLDGYGVLHLLSKDTATEHIPFIFLTAKAERSDQRKGMEMGADDYITKPFDDLELLRAVERRLKKSALLKKEFSGDIDGLNEFMQNTGNWNDLLKLSEANDVRYYKKKETIYTRDHYPRGIYFVSKGRIKTFRTNDDGKELITGMYGTGEFFGYLALLGGERYTDSASALEDSEICMIPKESFQSLVYNNAEVSRKFIRMLSGSIHEKEEQLLRLAYNSVRKRIAEALIILYNNHQKQPGESLVIDISREDLANLAGTAPETAVRTLSDFREDGIIEIKNGGITILQMSKLASLKN